MEKDCLYQIGFSVYLKTELLQVVILMNMILSDMESSFSSVLLPDPKPLLTEAGIHISWPDQ